MMNMFKKTTLAAFLLVAASAEAQNLNPEVTVTNTYVSRFSDTAKQDLKMAVPDSLHDFDYHFDYSVFESPYKGAYEFSPYSVTVKPDPTPFDAGTFHARFGAGWVLRPELDAVWTPLRKKKFSLSLVEKAKAYYGFFGDSLKTGRFSDRQFDIVNHTAVDGRVWMDKSVLKFDLGYDGFFFGADRMDATHSPFASARISSSEVAANKFQYDIGAIYRYYHEASEQYHDLFIDGELGGIFFDQKLSCLLDFNISGNSYYSGLDVAPHFDFVLGPVNLRAGARLGMDKMAAENASSQFCIYPDVVASVNLFKDHLQAFAFGGGGPEYNSLFGMKQVNSLIDKSYCTPEVTRVRLDVGGGFRGQIASRLQYDLRGGYKISQSVPLYFVNLTGQCIEFVDFKSVYAKASLIWHSESFDADAAFLFTIPEFSSDARCFAPSKYSGNISMKYNVRRRVFIGISAAGASDRFPTVDCKIARIPWYVDLGASLEYRISRTWSVWAKGGNLMNMNIARGPVYFEKGVSGILGVSVNL